MLLLRFTALIVSSLIFALLAVPATHAQTKPAKTPEHAHAHSHLSDHGHHHHDPSIHTTRKDARVLPPAKSDDVFHFAIYGDRTGGVPAGLEVLKQAVIDTNLLDPDLVMTVGDLIQGYNEEPEWLEQMRQYKSIMKGLNMKWFPVAGNHDVYWRGRGDAPQGQHESNFEKHFGPLWYSFKHKNAGFIVLYSDEGDPKTNRKGFNNGRLQTMSDQQLAFLDKSLRELGGADHVFVFLHHPRWIGGGYTGGNWDVVHQKLVDAGNVSAVFAGHIHHMRYDPKDGIEYHTLATTGGRLNGDLPDAGYLHHLNLVTVRKDRVSVAALPVGAVIDPRDFTAQFLEEIELARTIRPVQKSDALTLLANGSVSGKASFSITNPCPRDIEVTVSFDVGEDTGQWRTTLEHQHLTLKPNEPVDLELPIRRSAGNVETLTIPSVRLELEYIGQTARISLEDVLAPINLKLGDVSDQFFADSSPHCLVVESPQSAVRVDSEDIKMQDGPMTLEAWVRPKEIAGYNGIIAKTQGSEYAFFSDEGVPQFDIHLGGRYVSAKATKVMSRSQWTHLAGVYDGNQVMLFVNGELVSTVPGSGERRFNDLPLFIGADPNGRARPTRPFSGMIDEVRLSRSAIYSESFEPKKVLQATDQTVLLLHLNKNIGPFTFDRSSDKPRAMLMGPASKLVPVGN